jgi:hypothetical protein
MEDVTGKSLGQKYCYPSKEARVSKIKDMEGDGWGRL